MRGLGCIVMAGGEGVRLRPLTLNLPKPMLPVANKPLLELSLLHLKSMGFKEIILTAHYKAEIITRYFRSGEKLGIKLHYSLEETPLGTAGGVKLAMTRWGLDSALIWSGDILSTPELKEMLRVHQETGAVLTMAITRVSDPSRYGVTEIDEEGRLRGFVEKPVNPNPQDNLINTGIYIVEPDAMKLVPEDSRFDFARDLIPLLLRRNERIQTWLIDSFWLDIGSHENYLKANLAAIAGEVTGINLGKEFRSGVWLDGEIKLGENVRLSPPILVGRETEITSEAEVGPFSVIGERCSIGRAKIRYSVLWSGVKIEDESIVEDSLIIGGSKIKRGEIIQKKIVTESGVISLR